MGHDSPPPAWDIWQHLGHFWLSQWGWGGATHREVWGSSLGLLLALLSCTGPPHNKEGLRTKCQQCQRRETLVQSEEARYYGEIKANLHHCPEETFPRMLRLPMAEPAARRPCLVFSSTSTPSHWHSRRSCEEKNERLANLSFFLTSPHDGTEFLCRPLPLRPPLHLISRWNQRQFCHPNTNISPDWDREGIGRKKAMEAG